MVQCKISDPCVRFLHIWEGAITWHVSSQKPTEKKPTVKTSQQFFPVQLLSSQVRQEVCIETEPLERAFGSCAEEGGTTDGFGVRLDLKNFMCRQKA